MLRIDTSGAAMGMVLVPGIIGVVLTVILGIFLLQASTAFRKVALTDEFGEVARPHALGQWTRGIQGFAGLILEQIGHGKSRYETLI